VTQGILCLRRLAFAAVAFVALQFAATPAKAVTIGIAIDGSGSISVADFALQKTAYANLFSTIATNGTVAVAVVQFASTVQNVFSLTTISSVAQRNALVAAFNNLDQIGTTTAIGDAIKSLTTSILGAASLPAGKKLIDVSTDGDSNEGANPVKAAKKAVAGGIDAVNCLGVGGAANCDFTAGTGSFALTSPTFAQFEAALRTKLEREDVIVPEPATLALFAFGVAALGAARRMRNTGAAA